MKSTIIAMSALLAGVVSAQYNISSSPFVLVAKSDDAKYDNVSFTPCHEGAAIEGLCVGPTYTAGSTNTYVTYKQNTSVYESGQSYPYGTPGLLTYELQGIESESLTLYYDISTNVALPLFEPGYGSLYPAFDSNNLMNLQSSVDDTVTPPDGQSVKAYYRWHICETYFESYTYYTLAWVQGKEEPQNPSCVKVDVQRIDLP